MIKWWYSLLKGDTMEPCWSRICRLLKRHQILATFASSNPHRPWSWPLPGFGLREPWSHQWGPHWWTKKGISWNLFIHLFSSPLGTIQECQRSVEDVLKFLKAMKLLISRVSTTALVCGSWTLPLIKLWDHKQLCAIERICPKFNSYNACLASCIICLTKEFYPRLVRWRMQHNTLTQLWGIELRSEL